MTQTQSPHVLELYYFHRSFWYEKELSVASGTLSKVPPLVLWFEMWGAKGENIRKLRMFWDLG